MKERENNLFISGKFKLIKKKINLHLILNAINLYLVDTMIFTNQSIFSSF